MIDPCYFTDAEKYDEGVLVSGIRIAGTSPGPLRSVIGSPANLHQAQRS